MSASGKTSVLKVCMQPVLYNVQSCTWQGSSMSVMCSVLLMFFVYNILCRVGEIKIYFFKIIFALVME